jgi:hypothetical protein
MRGVANMIDEMRIDDLLDDMTGLLSWVRFDCHEDDLSGFVADELESIIKDAKELIDDLRESGIDSAKKEEITA